MEIDVKPISFVSVNPCIMPKLSATAYVKGVVATPFVLGRNIPKSKPKYRLKGS